MSFIYDASYGHARCTPAALKAAGSGGVILYAGCRDTGKNCTKAEVDALLSAGLLVGLVIENVATDMIGGAAMGDYQGQALMAAAKALGYDTDNCVLFTGYDTDSHAADWPKLLAAMEAFAKHVPVPGYYGDSDSIDYLNARHPEWIYWQSDSGSFSPKNPTPNAHLWQQFNDPRDAGLPVDVDLVRRTPLRLMGEPMALSDDDIQKIAMAVKHVIVSPAGDTLAKDMHVTRNEVDDIKAAVAKLSTTPGVDEAKIAELVVAKLVAKLSA